MYYRLIILYLKHLYLIKSKPSLLLTTVYYFKGQGNRTLPRDANKKAALNESK